MTLTQRQPLYCHHRALNLKIGGITMKQYTPSELASLAGVTPRTIRYYDQKGLLRPASRTPEGYRLYDSDALLKMQRISMLKFAGFSLGEIRDTLEMLRLRIYGGFCRIRSSLSPSGSNSSPRSSICSMNYSSPTPQTRIPWHAPWRWCEKSTIPPGPIGLMKGTVPAACIHGNLIACN